jgi:hypothetical protein
VPFRSGRARVESDTVVPQAQHDVVIILAHRDPHVPRLGVFHRVHHAFAGDVIHEQRDRSRQLDVGDITIEADR